MGQVLSEPVTTKSTSSEKNTRLLVSVSAMQGWRLSMEDTHSITLDLGASGSSFFAVFDGHGGIGAAQYAEQHLHDLLANDELFKQKKYEDALISAFIQVDDGYRKVDETDTAGCTAITALVTPDNKLFVANVGDSRAVISRAGAAQALSEDHKATLPSEEARVLTAGGFIEFGRVCGMLIPSRAIGDFDYKQNEKATPAQQIVTCVPEIVEYTITEEDEFLVLACDGIWDCMLNNEVVDFIRTRLAKKIRLRDICENIMDNCLAPDAELGNLGCDNMSIMIIGILHGRTEDEWYDWMASRCSPKRTK